MARLILMCGLPGAGKTTRATQLAADRPGVRLSPDDWMTGLRVDLFDQPFRAHLEDTLWTHAQTLLTLGLTVILDFGFWSSAERAGKLAYGRAHGIGVELHYVHAPLDELVRRLDTRNAAGPVVITRGLLEEYAPLFDPPTDTELSRFDPAP